MSHWYYNTSSGMMQHVTLPLVGQITSLFPQLTGWHELNIPGTATLAQAEAEAVKEFPGAATPTTNTKQALTKQIKSEVPTPTFAGLEAIGDFFQRLTQKNTWVRVGEVAVGGILLIAGLRALASGSPAVGAGARKTAAKPVRKVARSTARVVVPEARVITRTTAKRVAPKTTTRVAKHREHVAKYGAKKPYTPPKQRPPAPQRVTVRESHIYHHKVPKP